MKGYHVYGVGNALVDKEFEVQDGFLEELGIEKGLMTLVEREEQERLLARLLDTVGLKKRAGGGSAGNSLYALTQFGGRACFSCKVAADDTGDYYLEQLGHHNIDTTVGLREEGHSGRCLIMISPDADRTMLTCLGVSAGLSVDDLDFDAVARSQYAYVEGYLVASPPAKAAILELKAFAEKNGVKTAVTLSDPSIVEYFRDDIGEVLEGGVDLLVGNEREAMLFTGASSLGDACARLEGTAGRFVVTRGAAGARLFDGARYIDVPGRRVKAVDTTGAGDMFAGALLYAVTHGHDFAAAGRLAVHASAEVVSEYGPRLEAGAHPRILREAFGTESDAPAPAAGGGPMDRRPGAS